MVNYEKIYTPLNPLLIEGKQSSPLKKSLIEGVVKKVIFEKKIKYDTIK